MIQGINNVFLLGYTTNEANIITLEGKNPRVQFTLKITRLSQNKDQHIEFVKILVTHEKLVGLFLRNEMQITKNSLVLVSGKIHNRFQGAETEFVVLANLIKVMRDHAYMTMRNKTEAIKKELESKAAAEVILDKINVILSGTSFVENEMEAS